MPTATTYRILACPYCQERSGSVCFDTEALPRIAEQPQADHSQPVRPDTHFGMFSFGGRGLPCPHVVDMEIYIRRGRPGPRGLIQPIWSAEFHHESPLFGELDADGVARCFLFENIYLQHGPGHEPEFKIRTPHTVTGWSTHRFPSNRGMVVDVDVHAFIAEDAADFIRDLRQLAELEQLVTS